MEPLSRLFSRILRGIGLRAWSPDPGVTFGPEMISGMSVSELWRSQPHLRTVVAFRARNAAQLGLHVYRRTDDGRVRDRTSPLARVLARPGDDMSPYDLIFALVGDHDLHDRAYWVVGADHDGNPRLRRVPPAWVLPVRSDSEPWVVDHYVVEAGGRRAEIPAQHVVRFAGFDPNSVFDGSSTVQALRDTLSEQVQASKYRRQLWERGGRVSSVLTRPLDSPPWSKEAREAFREDWYAKYTGSGNYAGGTPILEDGMDLKRVDFSAADQQWVESARLSLETVASAYHVPAAMVGMGSETTFSNMRAFRKMLYTETLGPLLAQIEARVNLALVPMLGLDPDEYYVEFNIAEKLQGDFEEQAAVLSASTGRPWMTANEARGRMNLPRVDGGDELVVPLNVLVGGQASPRDSGSQNRVPNPVEDPRPKAVAPRAKSGPTRPEVDKHAQLLADFLARQGRSVRSRIGAGRDDWWDAERWDDELSDLLLRAASMVSTEAAARALEALGLDPKVYDIDRTLNFLREVARRDAESINATTYEHVEAQLDAGEDGDVASAFEGDAAAARVATAAVTLAGFAAGFGTVEAGKQSGARTKTWHVMSANPRPSHAAQDGMTIPIEDDFPNGQPWPGAGTSDPNEVAGCTCEVSFDI